MIRPRLTIRSLMLALIGVALLLWAGVSARSRAAIDVSTVAVKGITFHLSHPHLTTKGASVGAGEGMTRRGTAITWVEWTDGLGNGELLEFETETMRLRVGDLDYGPIRKGDVVAYGFGEVVVNGRARSPVTAQPRKGPPVWHGPDNLMPADVVIP